MCLSRRICWYWWHWWLQSFRYSSRFQDFTTALYEILWFIMNIWAGYDMIRIFNADFADSGQVSHSPLTFCWLWSLDRQRWNPSTGHGTMSKHGGIARWKGVNPLPEGMVSHFKTFQDFGQKKQWTKATVETRFRRELDCFRSKDTSKLSIAPAFPAFPSLARHGGKGQKTNGCMLQ